MWSDGEWVCAVGTEGQVRRGLGVSHVGSGWLRAVTVARGGSFSPHQGMRCPLGLLPELRDKLARRT